jgi:hypothetical protein
MVDTCSTPRQYGDVVQAHLDANDKARRLLVDIAEELRRKPAPGGQTRIHWGHVGDLNEINHKLEQVLRFIRNEG